MPEGRADEGRDDPAAALAGTSERVAHEVHATALRGGIERLGDGGLDALVGVRNHPLDAAGPRRGNFRRNAGPERLSLRQPDVHARISRRPPLWAPTAMMTT